MVDDFVSLHTHSDFSTLDGAGRVSEYVKVAKERGHRGISFTDHGTCRGFMSQLEQCKQADIKPIFGTEFYVAKNMLRKGLTDEEKEQITKGLKKGEQRAAIKEYEEREGIRDRWHITVWAENNEGLKNLYRLSSKAWIDGFYYKPRIDLEALIENGEGLIVASGCLASPINDNWHFGKRKLTKKIADRLQEAFGDRFYLEVQPHSLDQQKEANQLMLELRDRYGGKNKLLATQDAHYVNQKDAEHHEVLLCIGTGTVLSDPDRFKFDGDEFFFKTRKQMFESFLKNHPFMSKKLIKEALDSTLEFAERCTAKIETDYHKALLPDPGIPDKYQGNHFAYLKDLCLQGWHWREIPRRAKEYAKKEGILKEESLKKYVERLKYELSALKRLRFVPYFLMIRDLYRFAREASIMVGPGRGSVGGSLVAYLLGISSTDPIEHGLIFERFINPHRIDLPDIDMDFEDRRREEIIGYLKNKYGHDKVCQIATIGKLSGKQVLRDVSRVLEVPLNEVNKVTKSIIERSSGDERASQTVEDSFKDFEVCKQFDQKYPRVLHHVKRLEGLHKNLGMHAAGVIASPVPLTDLIPLEARKHEGRDVIVSAFEMYGVAANGLVKLDVLGLRTLTVIKDAIDMIEKRTGRKIDLEGQDVNLNDPKVLKMFTDHDYGGVFQYDTPSADKVCYGVTFDTFEDVAAMTALNRPGTSRSGLSKKYVKRKQNPELVKKIDFHPAVSKITQDTLGIIVYQEHVIRIFTEIAGFAPSTADSLRKTIAKKIGDETLGKERERFVEGAIKNTPGMTEEIANKIMDAIVFFGSYGFNKSHATAYGIIAFWCMWLKCYYPAEFYYALLKNEPDQVKVQQMAKDAAKHGIDLLPPHVSTSDKYFTLEGNTIRGSLVDIKGVGDKAADSIRASQPFRDLYDFVDRIDRRKVHKGAVLALAKAGALEGLVPNRKWFIENIDKVWPALISGKKDKARELIEASAGLPDYSEDDRALVASRVNPFAFGKHPIDAYLDLLGDRLKCKLADMTGDDEYFHKYDGKGHFVAGLITEVRYNQIGDFHQGRLPSEEERERMFWGARYAIVNLESPSGKSVRCCFEWDIFETYRPLIDKGAGTPVLCHVTASAFKVMLSAQFAVDFEEFRQRINDEKQYTLWEKVVTGDHPLLRYPWPNENVRQARTNNKEFFKKKLGGTFTGLVTNVRPKYDRKGGLMAYFGLLGADLRYVDVVAFSFAWNDVKHVIKPGALVKIELERKEDKFRGKGSWGYFFTGGRVKVLTKTSAA